MPYAPASLSRPEPDRQFSPHRKIYKTAAWLRFRTYRLSLNPICQTCERKGLVTPAVDVHHIVALRDGGQPYSVGNTSCECHACHSALTRSGR